MHSVPTLCATATILGVSSVGYALARHAEVEAAPSKAVPPVATTTSRTTTLSVPAAVPSSSSLPSPSEPSSRPHSQSRPFPHSRRRRKPVGRLSIGDLPLPRIRDDEEDRVNQSDSDIPNDSRALRPRSSWIKRLSSLSIDSSPTSSPRAESPAMSVSVSYNGSTAPIIPGHTTRPLPPNKLVKRSSSFRAPEPQSASGPKILQFRRPATSHQRAQTVESHSSSQPPNPLWHQNAAPPSPVSEPRPLQTDHLHDHDGQWQHYFTAKVSKEIMSRKRSSVGDVQYIKRILPNDKYPPTLIMAKALSIASVDVEELSSQDGDSSFYLSRPVTPSGFDTDTSTAHRRRAERTQSSPSLQRPEAEAKPRRSFSIGDFLATGPSWTARSKPSKLPKPTKKSGRRVFSSPLLGMGARHSIDVATDRSHLRRDVPDPVLFKQTMDRSLSGTPVSSQQALHNTAQGPTDGRSNTASEHSPAPRISPALDDSLLPLHTDISRSPTLSTSVYRPSRYSTTPSERASTLVGSDNEFRGVGSGDEEDYELNDDSAVSTLRMRSVRSNSKQRGPRIETIFDESPPKAVSEGNIAALRDVSPNSARKTRYAGKQFGQENISTPTRHFIPVGRGSSPSLNDIQVFPVHEIQLNSSPPDTDWDLPETNKADDNDDEWLFEDEEEESWKQDPIARLPVARTPPVAGIPLQLLSTPNSSSTSSRQIASDYTDKRNSIFDWSEQQPNERSPSSGTPPRPRTVHGKKDAEVRGPRSSRRAPSGLHARSQSVPVVPDLSGKRGTTGTNKFGTWGVGSKGGIPEDWDDDFDFGDTDTPKEDEEVEDEDERRIDSGVAMRVPDSIREQQSNVMANIGLLREWGLLIEELKELRVRAVSLGILEVSPLPSADVDEVWEEVDAMIDLADQEAQDEILQPPSYSPPSSPGFDIDAFEEMSLEPVTVRNVRSLSKSPGAPSGGDRFGETITPSKADPSRSQRKSILSENDIFGPIPIPATISALPSSAAHSVPTIKEEPTPQSTPRKGLKAQDQEILPSHLPSTPGNRPRKDSEAIARSVIEMLQKRKSSQDPLLPLQPVPQSKKVPFDTATLRHIVPYVHGLMRKVKDVIRDAEGLYRSPNASPRVGFGGEVAPRLTQIFREEKRTEEPHTPNLTPSRRKSRKAMKLGAETKSGSPRSTSNSLTTDETLIYGHANEDQEIGEFTAEKSQQEE